MTLQRRWYNGVAREWSEWGDVNSSMVRISLASYHDYTVAEVREKPKYEPGAYVTRGWTVPSPEAVQSAPYVVWWNTQPDLERWERVTVESVEEED